MEKVWAARAGLGYVARNGCLVTPEFGSWVVLAAMVLDKAVEAEAYGPGPTEERCGRCRLCVDACPTEALDGEGRVDARRCLSYQTIENTGPAPAELRAAFEGTVFGCDACQDVCPLNQAPVLTQDARFAPRPVAGLDARALAALTRAAYEALVPGTALARAGFDGLRRNAAYALGAARDAGARQVLEALRTDASPRVARSGALGPQPAGSVTRPPRAPGGVEGTVVALMSVHVLLSALTYLAAKRGVQELPPLTLLVWRLLVSAGTFAALLVFFPGHRFPPRGVLGRVALLGLLSGPCNQALFLVAMQHTTAAHGALIFSLTPLGVYLVELARGRERPRWTATLGIAVALAGVLLLLLARGVTALVRTLPRRHPALGLAVGVGVLHHRGPRVGGPGGSASDERLVQHCRGALAASADALCAPARARLRRVASGQGRRLVPGARELGALLRHLVCGAGPDGRLQGGRLQ